MLSMCTHPQEVPLSRIGSGFIQGQWEISEAFRASMDLAEWGLQDRGSFANPKQQQCSAHTECATSELWEEKGDE